MGIGAAAAGIQALGSGISGYMNYKGNKKQQKAAQKAMQMQIQQQKLAQYEQQRAYNDNLNLLGDYLLPQQRQQLGLDPMDYGQGKLYGNDPLSQQRAATGVLGAEAQQQFYNNYQEDPGTQYMRDQGLSAINAQAGAKGGLGSGSRLKAMTEFSQNLSNQKMNERIAQLGGLAQQDLSMVGGLANMRSGLGGNLAQSAQNIGQYGAQGYMNQGNLAANRYSGVGDTLSGITGMIGGALGGMGQAATPETSARGFSGTGGSIGYQPSNIAGYGAGRYGY